MSRIFLTKLHLVLAAFMFPVMLMFLVTGGLYTWGITGATTEEKVEVSISAPLDADDAAGMRAVAVAHLDAVGLSQPSGAAKVRKVGDSFSYEWTGSQRDVVVEPTADPAVAKVAIKEASLHRVMVQLHKAKGGLLFKIYATFLAVVLFLLVATGMILGWQVPALRKLTIISSGAGLILFGGLVAVS